ncbi:MAG: helix-turn-helix transcriptional regulator [Candidatus Omnitrophica bacterium]|nr:helix-turn-helix transcriptional regulator [Candidatus Omnitrophota bacterium]
MKLEKVNDHLNEKLKDPYFKELYELEDQKLRIVKRIVAHRIKHDLNQKQLADKAGVSQQHISKIENGEFSSIMTLEKVLIFIGYTVKIQAVPLKPAVLKKLNRTLTRRNLKAA